MTPTGRYNKGAEQSLCDGRQHAAKAEAVANACKSYATTRYADVRRAGVDPWRRPLHHHDAVVAKRRTGSRTIDANSSGASSQNKPPDGSQTKETAAVFKVAASNQ